MIIIITIGKTKEKYLKEGIEEFLKRIKRYEKIEYQEINTFDNLKLIDFTSAILNPHISHYSTDVRNDVRIVDGAWVIPYDAIESIQAIPEGELYMDCIVDDSRVANNLALRLKIKELKDKGIEDPDLERRLFAALR